MSQGGPLNASGGGGGTGMPIQTITGNVGGPVGPDAFNNFNLTANTTMGITTVGNAALHTINIVGIQSTTTQLGVVELATNAQAIAGADANNAVTSAALAAKLGTQTNHGLPIGAGTASAINWTADPLNGQLLIGSTGADPVLNTLTAGAGISIANNPGSITITNIGGSSLAYTAVNTTPYVVLPGDQFISVDSSGAPITIELPNAPAAGRNFVVKDRLGSAVANNITVTTVGGAVLIDGATTYVLKTNFQAISLIFSGTAYEVF